ncbi:3-oxoacyl-(acyl-carrier-protein) reductase [Mycolicibacterium rhodesiae JS60]|nr:3-oxoacyl-(acyl-carrier-protein) reductase [Mycolicibacterium rhodesiae JS60]
MAAGDVAAGSRRSVFLTGASSGIGAAIAQELVKLGYTVGCASRRGTVPFSSDGVVPIALDVTADAATRDALESFTESYGLVGLVNVAGAYTPAPSAELSLGELRRSLELNLVSSVRLAQLAHPHLKQRGGGFIANVGSFYGKLGIPGGLAYSAAKAALASVTRTLAVEWAPDGISVVNFAPGYVETELNAEFLEDPQNRSRLARKIPVGRIGTAAEIGRLVSSILDAQCGFLTGETITIDGAQSIRQ